MLCTVFVTPAGAQSFKPTIPTKLFPVETAIALYVGSAALIVLVEV